MSHLVAPGFRHVTEVRARGGRSRARARAAGRTAPPSDGRPALTAPGASLPDEQVAPFLDIDAHWADDGVAPAVDALFERNGRRCWNTHLRYEDLPRGGGARLIYIMRNGEDALSSFYRHLSSQYASEGGVDGPWRDFFEEFMAGDRFVYGRWQDNLASWSAEAARTDEGVLFLCYEDMLSRGGLVDAVGRIARHIGCEASEERIASVADATTMAAMKRDAARYNPESVRWRDDRKDFRFIGGARDQLFDADQQRRFRALTRERLERFERESGPGAPPCLLRRYADPAAS